MAAPRQTPLRMIGVILLLVSIGAGGFLYWRAARADDDPDGEVVRAQEQSRAYELAMQKNVGPVGLLMSRWSDHLSAPRSRGGRGRAGGSRGGRVLFRAGRAPAAGVVNKVLMALRAARRFSGKRVAIVSDRQKR